MLFSRLGLQVPRFECAYADIRQRLVQQKIAKFTVRPVHSSTRQTWPSPRIWSPVNRRKGIHTVCSKRAFSTTSPQCAKTIQAAKARSRMGPVSFASVVIFLGSGVGMIFYFRYEKARVERKRIAEASKGMGRPKVGGIFELIDQDGKPFSSEDGMKGRFSLVYFGFTHCPDICPEELDKMSQTLDILNPPKADQSPQSSTTSSSTADASTPTSSIWHPSPSTPALLPVFITCDPARDTPGVLKTYLAEFHPTIVGLTGTWEQIKAVCKLYRVYFSTPEGVKPGMDYLVDHSIYFYLMDPEGDFVEAIGRQHSPEQAARIIGAHMRDWERTGRTSLDPR